MSTLNPAIINFKLIDGNAILKGSDWNVEITIVDKDGSIETPFNLTGFIGKCQIRTDANSDVLIASPIFTLINPSEGTFSLSLNELETSLIPTTGRTFRDTTKYQYPIDSWYWFDEEEAAYSYFQLSKEE